MAPATAGLLAGIPPSHLPGLAGGAGMLLAGRLRGRPDALVTLLLATAGIPLGLALGHVTTAPSLSVPFLADGLAFLVVARLRRDRRWWRPAPRTAEGGRFSGVHGRRRSVGISESLPMCGDRSR